MIDYGKSPSNQLEMELPGLSSAGAELMLDVRRWAARHYEEFSYFKKLARQDSEGGNASAKYCLESMRRKYRVSVPNAYAPPLARIAMEEDKAIKFRLAKSKVDGFTTATL